MTLDEALEKWDVLAPGSWNDEDIPVLREWYAVANEKGIVAYFGNEADACRFRLNEVNRLLNG